LIRPQRDTINIASHGMSYYVNKLNNGECFSFAKYGDTEMLAAFAGKRKYRCTSHVYVKECGDLILKTLLNPKPYYYSSRRFRRRILQNNYYRLKHINFVNAMVFSGKKNSPDMCQMINALKRKRVCAVGHRFLNRADFLVSGGHVLAPSKDCYFEYSSIKDGVLSSDADVFAISLSMVSNILIYDLFDKLGQDKWLIDFGSFWDPLVGVASRPYHKEDI